MSEAEKRKHASGGDDDVSGTQKKARDEVTDEEVDEFYAILRRINVAVKHFKNGDDREEGSASHKRWRASLEAEIMQQVNGVKEKTKRRESLDLNLSPNPE